mgnify:CR=1 FL=1
MPFAYANALLPKTGPAAFAAGPVDCSLGNKPMSKLLLTAKAFASEAFNAICHIWRAGLPHAARAAVITTASAEWKERNRNAIAAHHALAQLGFSDPDYIDIEFQAAAQLNDYHLIYISGGNPFYLLYQLKQSGADEVLRKLYCQGVYLIGCSAGAVVLGPDIRVITYFDTESNRMGLTDFAAVGIVPFSILPHVNRLRTQYIDFDVRVQNIRRALGHEVVLLADEQSLLLEDGVRYAVGA